MNELIRDIESLLAKAVAIKYNDEIINDTVEKLSRDQEPERVARLLYLTDMQYTKALYNELEYWIDNEQQNKGKDNSL
jgi:tRNA U38,U39,U40 pseudouridine synthase TruA